MHVLRRAVAGPGRDAVGIPADCGEQCGSGGAGEATYYSSPHACVPACVPPPLTCMCSVQVVYDVAGAIGGAMSLSPAGVAHRDITPTNFGHHNNRGVLFDFSAGKVCESGKGVDSHASCLIAAAACVLLQLHVRYRSCMRVTAATFALPQLHVCYRGCMCVTAAACALPQLHVCYRGCMCVTAAACALQGQSP